MEKGVVKGGNMHATGVAEGWYRGGAWVNKGGAKVVEGQYGGGRGGVREGILTGLPLPPDSSEMFCSRSVLQGELVSQPVLRTPVNLLSQPMAPMADVRPKGVPHICTCPSIELHRSTFSKSGYVDNLHIDLYIQGCILFSCMVSGYLGISYIFLHKTF